VNARLSPTPAQRRAADPARSVWVPANAGTGKTRVLSDRVLRLLLAGARPDAILCLTFTKAAAAEMGARIERQLAAWAVARDEKALAAEIEELTGEPISSIAVDGCGAPQFAFHITGLARAFRRLATAPEGTPEQRAAAAMRAHPVLIGGTGRDVSELMAAVPGLVAKEGAEGVYAAALPDGRAMAVKVDDGAMRPLPALLAGVLRAWGHDGEAIERWSAPPILGGGRPVGAIRMRPLEAIANGVASGTLSA
jgi:hypothetical protein